MWASNTKGVHTTSNAKLIFNKLQVAEQDLNNLLKQNTITPEQAQTMMKQNVKEAGENVFSCY